MEAYEIDPIKIEKQKALRRYRTFQKIATFLKTLEIFFVLFLLFWSVSWSSAYLPAAVKLVISFLRRVFSILFSPHFVFIIGNAIVITLFVKSGDRSSSSYIDVRNTDADIFSGEDERELTASVAADVPASEPETVPAEEERVLEVTVVKEELKEPEEKIYRRTKSSVEIVLVKEEEEEKKKELRRSETEPRRKIGNGKSTTRSRRMYDVDDLSSEDFRRKVEAFIEKQQTFLREESKAVVLSNRSHSL